MGIRSSQTMRRGRFSIGLVVIAWHCLGLTAVLASPAWAEPHGSTQESGDHRAALPSGIPEELNIRLSSKALVPPDALIVRRVPLTGLHIAQPFVGPPIHSAILEDDVRDRVVILTSDSRGQIVAYLLKDFQLTPYLPSVQACAQRRRCATDRMPATGGIACIAICLREALTAELVP